MSDKIRVAAMFGANLNMLGRRNAEHYGVMTLDEVTERMRQRAEELGCDLVVVQSNSESELIEWVHANRDEIDGYIINPGGFTMHAQGWRDSIVDTGAPLVELHWSNIHNRGIKSLWTEAAVGQVCGFHWRGAPAGLEILVGLVEDRRRDT